MDRYDNAGNQELVNFYEEIARIKQKLQDMGLLETPPGAPAGTENRVERYVLAVTVEDIWAEAGSIDIRSDRYRKLVYSIR